MENNELQHHGILGMKWGVRRFQKKDGSLTAAGKKRRTQEEVDEKSREEQKQKALKSGSAEEVLKFKGELTKQEMDSAIARIRWERDMSDIAAKEAVSKTDKVFEKIGKVTDYAGTAAKGWNMIANVYNAFNNNDIILPKIDTNITSGNRSERKAAEKEKQKAAEAQKRREEQEAQKESKRKEREAKKAKQQEDPKPEKEEPEVVTGTVSGSGTSKGSQKKKSRTKSTDTIYDVEYEEVTNNGKSYSSNLPAVRPSSGMASTGQSFVAGLLED